MTFTRDVSVRFPMRRSDAKVGDQRVLVLEEDISRLDVAVYDPVQVSVVESPSDVECDLDRFGDRKPPFPVNPLSQRLTLNEGHDLEKVLPTLPGRQNRNNVRRGELRSEIHFPQKALAPLFGEPPVHDLDDDQAIRMRLAGEIDAGHPAPSQLPLDALSLRKREIE
jgi:hypothetical protein